MSERQDWEAQVSTTLGQVVADLMEVAGAVAELRGRVADHGTLLDEGGRDRAALEHRLDVLEARLVAHLVDRDSHGAAS